MTTDRNLSIVRESAAPRTFELLSDWRRFAEVGRNMAPRTVHSYLMNLLRLQAFVLPRAMETATEDDLLRFLESFHAKGSARRIALQAAKSFFGWAADHGDLAEDPTRRLRVKKAKEGPAPYLSREELTRVVLSAAVREPRRAWTILLLANTGLRRESAIQLALDDVRDGVLHVRVAKKDQPYAVPLNRVAAQAVAELSALARERGYATLLGVGAGRLSQWLSEAGQDAGIRVYPHLLRHSFATRLAEAGVHPVTIAELMNHGDLSQLLRRYVAVADPVRREAVERIT